MTSQNPLSDNSDPRETKGADAAGPESVGGQPADSIPTAPISEGTTYAASMPSHASQPNPQYGSAQLGPGQYAGVPTAPVASDRSATFWILLGVGIFSFFCLVICSGIVGLMYFIGQSIPADRFAEQIESDGYGRSFFQRINVPEPEKDYFSDTSFADSLAKQSVQVSVADRQSIEALIDAVMAEAPDDEAALRRYVSPEGFVRQMLRSNPNLVMRQQDLQAIKNGFDEICYGPELFAGHRILSIESVDSDDVVVTMLVWDYTESGEVMRWWIERPTSNAQGRWLLCDWKGTNYCVSEAAYYEAIYSESGGNRLLSNFYDFTERLYAEDLDVRNKALEDFEDVELPANLRGQLAYRVAGAWLLRGELDRAEDLLSTINEWTAKASRLDIEFRIALRSEDWSEVIRRGGLYLEQAGNDPWVMREIANAHVELDQIDQAEAIWKSLAQVYPLSVVVPDDIGNEIDKYGDPFLREYMSQTASPDQAVLAVMPDGYGLRVVPGIERCRSLGLDLKPCTTKFIESRLASAVLDHERAIELLREVVADEESANIELFDDAYYGEPTSTNLKAAASEIVVDLESIILTLEQRMNRSEDKKEFVSQWYWDEYMEEGEEKDLQSMVRLTETEMPGSIEFRFLKSEWLAAQGQWEELSKWLATIPQLEKDSEWKSELVSLRLSTDIELGKPVSELSKYKDQPYFYTTVASRLVQRKDWTQLEALLQDYDLLSTAEKNELGSETYLLGKKGELLIGKGDFEAARQLYKGMLKSSDNSTSYLATSGLLKVLRADPEGTSKLLGEVLVYDQDGDMIRSVLRYLLERKNVAMLEDLKSHKEAEKYSDVLDMASSYLQDDKESLHRQVRTDLRRKEKALEHLPYAVQRGILYDALQDALAKNESTFAQAIATYLETQGNAVGSFIIAIDKEEWKQVADLVEDGIGLDVYQNPSLATWRQSEAFQEFIGRFGWQSWFTGEQIQIVYDQPLFGSDDSVGLETMLSNGENQWSRKPDLEEELLDTKQQQNLQIWSSEDEPRWLLVAASLPADDSVIGLEMDFDSAWQRDFKSALFVIARQSLDQKQQDEMRSFAFGLSKKAVAVIQDYQCVSRKEAEGDLDEAAWNQHRDSYYGSFPSTLLATDSQRPQWQVMRDRYKACLEADLKVGDSVKVRLEHSNLTEVIEAETVKVGKFSDDAGVRVKLKADSVLLPFRKDDLVNVEWYELSFE